MDDAGLLDLAARLAAEAGALILRIQATGFVTRLKADTSLVTEADDAAEALIVAGLRIATPDIPIIAEEAASVGTSAHPGSCFWLVDPLDGTREFAQGTPDFAVNVGLVRDGAAVLGAVALPAHGQLFGGRPGHGAWVRDDAGARAIRARVPPSEGLTVVASRHYADDPALTVLLDSYRVATLHNIGSAVKFCRIAEGRADLYPRLGATMEWDTAAPHAVLEAAGGSLAQMDGTALRYGKPGWRNPPFMCRGRQAGPSGHG